jgi:glucose/arabinose dehydrogenase
MGPRITASLTLVLYLPAFVACTVTSDPDPVDTTGPADIELQEIVTDLSAPVFLTAPSGDLRLFIVEKAGRVLVVRQGELLPTPFLDITGQVSSNGERGLLSLAFHPDYPTTGYFFVYYTDPNGDSRVVRYSVSPNPDRADPGSATEVLFVAQPYSNHNGGLITFGPDDMLYIGLGDGGSGGDPDNNGQDRSTLLGSLLRIDVDGAGPYAVPTDNPFVADAAVRDEIWAYGLRNPWRFSFDFVGPTLYLADVGQNSWEEVNAVSASVGGHNFGWRLMEGSACFSPADCDPTGLVVPVLEYSNGTDGCAVVGGYVYRGTELTGLTGTYFYSDNCSGWIRSFRLADGIATDQREWDLERVGPVLSFGQDGAGELYVLSGWGSVHKLAAVN